MGCSATTGCQASRQGSPVGSSGEHPRTSPLTTQVPTTPGVADGNQGQDLYLSHEATTQHTVGLQTPDAGMALHIHLKHTHFVRDTHSCIRWQLLLVT